MTARRVQPAPAGDDGDQAGRNCEDCVPPLWIQGGPWGWSAHRHALHDEGPDPGPHPPPAYAPKREPKGWNDVQRAEFHRNNQAARRRQQHTPPARSPRPPRSTG